MNEKIQRLIEELAEECQKEDVALLCTIGDCATAKNSIVGNLVELGFLLAVQEKKLMKYLRLMLKSYVRLGLRH